MKITSVYNAPLDVWDREMPPRAEGLHLSDIYNAMAQDLYPKWFKKWEATPEDLARHVGHFEKGLVLEKAWGDAMAQMLGPLFSRPTPRQEEGVWCSPDGFMGKPLGDGLQSATTIPPPAWPAEYPELRTPSIHECKVTLKSCNEDTSPIEHEKFVTWEWQVKGYCYPWRCHTAYIYVLHLCGDYKDRPWTPMAAVHRFDFTAGEVAAHWALLMQEAEKRGLR